ncbi:unnamed protein product [Arctia plantaginis]|uniref:Phosphoribulokinase/uridine kinase domain-containing protein n=1 Tax=Arctia plantaginis TaxID=874455 RepID=A0A8S0Z2B6_ARCPL|nr:unnamed protein product [Arctia plantaginis]CAB3240373.1 unnamed protein product [Arctia plantaginis]
MNHRNEWIIIGISGVTCGGKTSLANQLNMKLSPVYTFHQDKYFYPDDSPHHIKCENLDHNNYDILSALDMETMYKDICATIEGTDKSHYSSTHDGEHIFKIPNKKFLVIEGFTVLNYEPIMKLCNLSYYFVLEYGECFARRCLRVYEPPDVPGYFELCVWPEHLRYRQAIEKNPRVTILDGKTPNSLDIVMDNLKTIMEQKT